MAGDESIESAASYVQSTVSEAGTCAALTPVRAGAPRDCGQASAGACPRTGCSRPTAAMMARVVRVRAFVIPQLRLRGRQAGQRTGMPLISVSRGVDFERPGGIEGARIERAGPLAGSLLRQVRQVAFGNARRAQA